MHRDSIGEINITRADKRGWRAIANLFQEVAIPPYTMSSQDANGTTHHMAQHNRLVKKYFDERIATLVHELADTNSSQHYFVTKHDSATDDIVALETTELFTPAMYIYPGAQEKGIGTSLLQAVLDEAQLGVTGKPLSLLVTRMNEKAIRFYTKMGFQESGEGNWVIANVDGQEYSIPTIRMAKDLS